VRPGTAGLEHRIGGIEKDELTGNVSYAPGNHELMVRTRARKVAEIVREIPPTDIHGLEVGDVLLVGWGGTYGAIAAALEELRAKGRSVAHVHLRYLNPLPSDLGGILRRFKKVLVPELNMGQLLKVLRAEYAIDAVGLDKIQGQPFKISEIVRRVEDLLEEIA
jgi:2-oxoglutarate ferredoxin oxidoreductase subunit alpha